MAQPQSNTTEPDTSLAVNVNAGLVAPEATATTLQGTSSDPPNPSVPQSSQASQLPSFDPQPGQNVPQSFSAQPNFVMNGGFSSSGYGLYPDASGIYGSHGPLVHAQYGPGFNIIDQTANELALELSVRMKHTQRLPYLILIALSVTEKPSSATAVSSAAHYETRSSTTGTGSTVSSSC
ncbi:hypothetical protein N7505_007730 [Penicillium chrysogenum]|uniref:Uncharacterized protein n=1 Tax=Penicillium chrysogenum TaxID=5076 RepID=A0ABQ8WE75_PENCH|nr:hypothetical protein N7505_007730 [Penicillium chrysogenum]